MALLLVRINLKLMQGIRGLVYQRLPRFYTKKFSERFYKTIQVFPLFLSLIFGLSGCPGSTTLQSPFSISPNPTFVLKLINPSQLI